MKSLLGLVTFWLLFSASMVSAQAKPCANYNDEITISGVATLKATYVSPDDFGWAPKNGYLSYPVLVTTTPICFDDKPSSSDPVEHVDGVYVLQLFGVTLPSNDALWSGVPMTVKGKVFPAETAHHFEKLLIDASSITISK